MTGKQDSMLDAVSFFDYLQIYNMVSATQHYFLGHVTENNVVLVCSYHFMWYGAMYT